MSPNTVYVNHVIPQTDDLPSFLPDVLSDLTDFIWREGTPPEAMTGRAAPLSDGLLAEVFLSCKANARRSVHNPQDSPLPLATDVTLGESCLWLGTRTGGGGTATLTESFFGRSPWLHGQQVTPKSISGLERKYTRRQTV